MGKIVTTKELNVGDRVKVMKTWYNQPIFKGKTGTVIGTENGNIYINFDEAISNGIIATYYFNDKPNCYYGMSSSNETLELLERTSFNYDFSKFGEWEPQVKELINQVVDYVSGSEEETPKETPKGKPKLVLKVGDIVRVSEKWCGDPTYSKLLGKVIEIWPTSVYIDFEKRVSTSQGTTYPCITGGTTYKNVRGDIVDHIQEVVFSMP